MIGLSPLELQLIELHKEFLSQPSAHLEQAISGLQCEVMGNWPAAIAHYQQSAHAFALSRLSHYAPFLTRPTAMPQQPIYHEHSGYYGTPLPNQYRHQSTPIPSGFHTTHHYTQPVSMHFYHAYREIPHQVLSTEPNTTFQPPKMSIRPLPTPATNIAEESPTQASSSKQSAIPKQARSISVDALLEQPIDSFILKLNARQKSILSYLYKNAEKKPTKEQFAKILNIKETQLTSTCGTLKKHKLMARWPQLTHLGIRVGEKIHTLESERRKIMEEAIVHPLVAPMQPTGSESEQSTFAKTLLPLRAVKDKQEKQSLPAQPTAQETETKKKMGFAFLNN
ncbi:hypothetical protein [Candidatus Berkiella aquae]|uniref:Uncharacterized protein n=1 Tax=Candidatus Berkiella aquae TaxID=295108 RepID=A0A0Q9YY23_9GAMM|nr:hypothetical protein [Candidatus Berkiella aquae]MCS5711567.1 hypothetical protein [Candidatus Berkiella aquae]